jgi:uncharacterized protein involved in type VI secretion and phage assembly
MTATTQGNGIVIGLVTSLEDPDKLGRIQVKYPCLGQQKSDWARLVTPMAGKDRGLFFRHEVGDEVLVAHELGDLRRPYILGGLWSTEDKPPPDDGKAKENNHRFIRSRSGHVIRLDDTNGKERIEIIDKDGARRMVIDSSGKRIAITCESGDIEIKAEANLTIQARTITIKADQTMTIQAGGQLTIKGATVAIN